jgi:hypothetical protein
MKTSLALLALLSLAAPAGAAVVELFGYTAPAVLSVEAGLSFFVAAFTLMIFGSAYGGAVPMERRRRAVPVMLPASEAFTRGRRILRAPGAAGRKHRAAPLSSVR